ncbi:Fc.00g010270.m01.CDS01, partial [Cosmosporella sp. VM-42]
MCDATVLYRLKRLEEHVGLSEVGFEDQASNGQGQDDAHRTISQDPGDPTLDPLRPAIQLLISSCSTGVDPKIWTESLIKRLWLTFHDAMFEMHFLPNRRIFSSPTPLLLASMLYCSSIRGSPEVAEFASGYFKVLCSAIAQLCIPSSDIGKEAQDPALAEAWAFKTVLGIILAGLLREGISRETDLEHAAIHLSCPTIPVTAPFDRLRVSLQDQLCRLSRMMHTGLSHFTGRGLPTIWSYFSGEAMTPVDAATSFSDVDGAVIRDWARQLDDWLVEFGAQTDEPDIERKLTFRQYVLHRVLVLSIYLPARGSYIFTNTTVKEQHELLASARAAVKLHVADPSIWANFDLIIITWAALIIIQGVEGGAGEPD